VRIADGKVEAVQAPRNERRDVQRGCFSLSKRIKWVPFPCIRCLSAFRPRRSSVPRTSTSAGSLQKGCSVAGCGGATRAAVHAAVIAATSGKGGGLLQHSSPVDIGKGRKSWLRKPQGSGTSPLQSILFFHGYLT